MNKKYSKLTMLKWKIKEGFKWCLRLLIKVSVIGGAGYAIFMAGAYLNPVVSYATQEKIVPVQMESPVMARIAKCESTTGHYGKNGQVSVNGNTNGSVDIGKYQINTRVWGETAKGMGYDLSKEKDNEAFAMWLYANHGTQPWYSSEKCWK